MSTPVIAGAVRTPIGVFMGALSSVPATDLGAVVIREALVRAGVALADVDDVLMGCIFQAGLGQGPARQSAIAAGLPASVPAATINMLCGSGLRAVGMAAQAVRSGDAEVIVAGGMENMSRAPRVVTGTREGTRLGDLALRDALVDDGLWCAITNQHMGSTAERVAERFGISREDQDAFAAESQRLAHLAAQREHFREEIVPVSVPQRRGDPVLVSTDEHPRPDATLESLAALRPAFEPEGTVTAGNASGINDGAAAMVVLSEERAAALGVKPMARILGYAWHGVEPEIMGIGPVQAVRIALERAGVDDVRSVELFEVNEAFAAQALAVQRELGIGREVLNVNGGAIALGHPVGASGARILVTLLHEMRHREARLGVAALCVGGGMGVAMVVESAG
ncbi:MAG: acetyl-CoA C-acetyltransferase [Thermoleophilia bacterium]|nr:acetyl-CoA C-acetyltransferase [Thermoleophilia bacterium]